MKKEANKKVSFVSAKNKKQNLYRTQLEKLLIKESKITSANSFEVLKLFEAIDDEIK